jgi:hypothetical protein
MLLEQMQGKKLASLTYTFKRTPKAKHVFVVQQLILSLAVGLLWTQTQFH